MKSISDKYFTFMKQFVPEKSDKPTVGIDIGISSCKMVELKRNNGSFQLLSWAIEPVVNGDKKKAVKAVLGKLNTPSNSPTTSLFGKGTLIRYIDMPQMTPADLKKSFAFEIDRHFPFPKDQVYADCYILDREGKEGKMSILAAAAKKELIDGRMALLRKLGLQSNFITLNPIAVANVLNVLGLQDVDEEKVSVDEGGDAKGKTDTLKQAGKEKEHQVVAILDMGEEVSNLIILEDGLPRFARDIFVGGHDLTKNISSASGVDIKEAEKLKCQPGANLTKILGEKDSVVLNLALEMRLSLDYFVTERGVPVSQLLLLGGASLLDGWEDIFSKYLELKVKRWNPLAALDLSNAEKNKIDKNTGRLAVALGLALYQ